MYKYQLVKREEGDKRESITRCLLIIYCDLSSLAGVSDGQTLRVPVGHTEAYVTLRVSSSDTFRRDGFDVHSDANISYAQAVLGGVAKTSGLNGTLDLKVWAWLWAEPHVSFFLDSARYTISS